MPIKAALNFQLQGYQAANRDAIVKLTHEATGTQIERKPFLDGSLLVRGMDPGFYEMEVRHPNLVVPIEKRRIRLFPQTAPTRIFVPVAESLFRDSPIRDIPDADLGPIQQQVSDASDRVKPVGDKLPGEAIRAADWNALVGAVQDLSNAVQQLTNLVAPQGHDHAEIAEKIGEVQGNLRRFAEAFGRSLIEIRREIETADLRRNVRDVLDRAGASEVARERVNGRLGELVDLVQSNTPTFTQKLSNLGSLLMTEVNQMAVEQGEEADAFLAEPIVKELTGKAQQYFEAGIQTEPEQELLTYQRSTTAGGGQKMLRLF